jgi:hypothetical protein
MTPGRSRQRRSRRRSHAAAAISFLVFGASSSLLLPYGTAVAFLPPPPPPPPSSSSASSRNRGRERRIDYGHAAGRRRGAAGIAVSDDDDDDDDDDDGSDDAAHSTESPRRRRESSSFGAAGTARRPPPVYFDDPDSVSRRRLVLSLFASASLSPLVADAAIVVADDYYADPAYAAASATATATPAGGNGNGNAPPPSAKIIKPPLDKRSYDTFVLPNGLRVLLCSDPSSTTSAVAMNVHVGACSDPVEVPGLAHFCEHMLFLGTEMYPVEDSFSKFLSSNGERRMDGWMDGWMERDVVGCGDDDTLFLRRIHFASFIIFFIPHNPVPRVRVVSMLRDGRIVVAARTPRPHAPPRRHQGGRTTPSRTRRGPFTTSRWTAPSTVASRRLWCDSDRSSAAHYSRRAPPGGS